MAEKVRFEIKRNDRSYILTGNGKSIKVSSRAKAFSSILRLSLTNKSFSKVVVEVIIYD